MNALLQNSAFRILWVAALCSAVASALTMMSFSALIFNRTGSHFQSATIFGVSLVLPSLLLPISQIASRMLGYSSTLILASSFQLALIAILFIDFKEIVLVYLIFAFRGYFETLEKSNRMISLKLLVPSEMLEKGSSYIVTALLLGNGIAASLSVWLVDSPNSLPMFVAAGLYLAVIICYAKLHKVEKGPDLTQLVNFSKYLSVCKASGLIWLSLGWLSTVAVIQGFHNVARTAFASDYLGLKTEGIFQLQIVATAGVVSGAIIVGRFMQGRTQSILMSPFFLFLVTSLNLFLLCLCRSPEIGLLLYFTFMTIFEVSFVRFQNMVIIKCPKKIALQYFTTMNALLSAGMAIGILLIGYLMDQVGFRLVTISLTIFCVICAAIFWYGDSNIPES